MSRADLSGAVTHCHCTVGLQARLNAAGCVALVSAVCLERASIGRRAAALLPIVVGQISKP